jgi:2-dehydro-3-deoxygalactonokinase
MTVACVAVDWGTSNRRAFRIAPDGTVIARFADDRGVLNVDDFAGEVAAMQRWAAGAPLLLAGSIGSNRGWIEAPYVTAPAGIADVAAAIIRPQPGVGIVPGVAVRNPACPAVMRGEEVQLFGALALGAASDGLFCHPGTHSKWITARNDRITGFTSVMTGDLLAALTARSILSDLLALPADDDMAFGDGVDTMLAGGDVTAELFGVRARVLTGHLPPAAASSRISGLLIGADIIAGLRGKPDDRITLVGSPGLCRRFALALARAGRSCASIDGEAAFLAGVRAILRAT